MPGSPKICQIYRIKTIWIRFSYLQLMSKFITIGFRRFGFFVASTVVIVFVIVFQEFFVVGDAQTLINKQYEWGFFPMFAILSYRRQKLTSVCQKNLRGHQMTHCDPIYQAAWILFCRCFIRAKALSHSFLFNTLVADISFHLTCCYTTHVSQRIFALFLEGGYDVIIIIFYNTFALRPRKTLRFSGLKMQ